MTLAYSQAGQKYSWKLRQTGHLEAALSGPQSIPKLQTCFRWEYGPVPCRRHTIFLTQSVSVCLAWIKLLLAVYPHLA